MIYIHAGHNAPGKAACGATGYLDESKAAREILAEVAKLLPGVHCFSVDDGAGQQDVLNKIVEITRASDCELSISIHLNASTHSAANGVEAYVYDTGKKDALSYRFADRWLTHMETLGYKVRGIKCGSHLQVIRKITAPAVLLECGFVTSKEDAEKYDAKKFAKAIAHALEDLVKENHQDIGTYTVIAGEFTSREMAEKRLKIVQDIIPGSYIVRR